MTRRYLFKKLLGACAIVSLAPKIAFGKIVEDSSSSRLLNYYKVELHRMESVNLSFVKAYTELFEARKWEPNMGSVLRGIERP